MKIFKTIIVTCAIAINLMKVYGQDTIAIDKDDYDFRETGTVPIRMRAYAKESNSFLKNGLYKTTAGSPLTIFAVNDSGYLHGSWKIISWPIVHETTWSNGRKLREFIYEHDKLKEEAFDSSVSVYLYDSLARNWKTAQRTVKVRKVNSRSDKEWSFIFTGGPSYAYALLYYKNGKMIAENYPAYLHRIYNDKGELAFEEAYNWKLKQIERTNFKDGVVTTKSVSRDKNMQWNNNGSTEYLLVGDLGEDKQTVMYEAGKLVYKEVFKHNKKTVTAYDNKGKIKSKTVYELPKVDNNMRLVE